MGGVAEGVGAEEGYYEDMTISIYCHISLRIMIIMTVLLPLFYLQVPRATCEISGLIFQ